MMTFVVRQLSRVVGLGAIAWSVVGVAVVVPAQAQTGGQGTGTLDTSAVPRTTRGAAQPTSPFGVITGLVADSLNGGPLVGAQISVEGINSQAVTDSTGRFRVDSVPPGTYRVGVFHPVLDSLALSLASPPLTITAGSTLSLIFATPSAQTYLRLACGTATVDTMAGVGPSELMGRVLDAETERPVAHVWVTLSWTDIGVNQSTGLRRIRRVRDTTTGPGGEFLFCHLPANVSGVVRATNVAVDSSVISRPFAMERRLVKFLVLHVPSIDTAMHIDAAQVTSDSALGGGVLTGRVIRPDGEGPLTGAQVSVAGTTAVTGDSGQFTLRGLPTGTRTLQVRALGWEPVSMPVELTQRAPVHVTVPLAVKTAVLRAVVVTAMTNAGLHRVGFDTRKQFAMGQFLSPADIARREATETLDLLAGVRGLARRVSSNGDDFLVATRGFGGCVSYVVDGMPYVENRPGDIDGYLQPQDIGAIEVYQASESPAQYAYTPPPIAPPNIRRTPIPGTTVAVSSMGTTSCVKVVIWTKARLGI